LATLAYLYTIKVSKTLFFRENLLILTVKNNDRFLLKFTLAKVGAGMTNREQEKNEVEKVNIR